MFSMAVKNMVMLRCIYLWKECREICDSGKSAFEMVIVNFKFYD